MGKQQKTNDGGENIGLFNDLKLFKPTKTKILLTTIQIISGTKTFKNFLIKITIISIWVSSKKYYFAFSNSGIIKLFSNKNLYLVTSTIQLLFFIKV